MSADVTAIKRGNGGKFISASQFEKRLLDVERLDELRLQPKVREKVLIPDNVSDKMHWNDGRRVVGLGVF